jgi:hypothetical protein
MMMMMTIIIIIITITDFPILTARLTGGSKFLRHAGFPVPNFKPPHPTDP